MVNATTAGPADHLSFPRLFSVLVGMFRVGPTPQMTSLGAAGEKKAW